MHPQLFVPGDKEKAGTRIPLDTCARVSPWGWGRRGEDGAASPEAVRIPTRPPAAQPDRAHDGEHSQLPAEFTQHTAYTFPSRQGGGGHPRFPVLIKQRQSLRTLLPADGLSGRSAALEGRDAGPGLTASCCSPWSTQVLEGPCHLLKPPPGSHHRLTWASSGSVVRSPFPPLTRTRDIS